MSRDEVEQEVDRLNRDHPERGSYRWLARSSADGEWSIARIPTRPGARIDPLKTSTEAKPKPPQAEDPRSAFPHRNVPGYGA